MSFSSTHSQILKLNNYDLRDLGGTASFEASAISGRGLAPTRERELQFPGQMGSRDYGSYYGNRRIEISGTLYADSINDFRAGLDKIKELCRLRTFVDGILYEQVEAQMLWFADESVVAGPYTLTAVSQVGPASSIFDATDAIGNYPSAYSSDDDLIGFELEFANRGATVAPRKYTINSDGNVVSTGRFFCSPYYDLASPPTVGDTFWIVDNRYYLVNYSGTMNEERMTAQWFKTGYSRLTLPFKAVYPFAVSDPKQVDFTPNSTNGYFKAIDTGNAISYPVYKVKGAADTPQIVEATHSLVWNANNNDASNILGESVSATVSAAGFYGQTGKLNQAIAFDANQDRTQFDSLTATNPEIRKDMGIGPAINLNQGTASFWFKKSGDYSSLGDKSGEEFEYFLFTPYQFSIYRYRTSDGATHRLYYQITDQYGYMTLTDTTLEAGNWYLANYRWDTRRQEVSASNYYQNLIIYDTSGDVVISGARSINPTEPGASAVNDLAVADHGVSGVRKRPFEGLIDDLAIWDLPLSDTEVSTLVNGGTGVRADTVASSELVYYSDFDQTVGTAFNNEQIASSNMDTAQVTATSGSIINAVEVLGYGNKIFFENDRVVIYDETGYKVQGFIDEADAGGTSLNVDNGSGSIVTDLDKVGVYATLNGSNQYFAVADNANHDVGTGDFSFSAWFKTDDLTGNYGLLGKYTTTGIDYGYYIYQGATSGIVYLFCRDQSGVPGGQQWTTLGTNTDDKWHHVAVSVTRAGNVIGYMDGVVGQTQACTTTANMDTDSKFTIGQTGTDSNLLKGSIKDVRLYKSVLSAADVLSLATGPLSSVGGTPTCWYKMNEASLSPLTDSGSAGVDLTAYQGGGTVRTQLAYISKNLIADGGMENGGIGGWGVGTNLTSHGKDTSTVKKDAHGIEAVSSAAAHYAYIKTGDITVAADENYVFRGWGNSGTATNGQYTYLTGDTSGDYAVYGTPSPNGEWHFLESAVKIVSPDTRFFPQLLLQNSPNAVKESYWDDLKLLPNLVNNGGMEGTYVAAGGSALGDIAPGWQKVYDYASTTYSKDLSEHSGSAAQKIACTASHQNGIVSQVNDSLVAGQWYEQAMWFKSDAGQATPLTGYSVGDPSVWSYSLPESSAWHRHSFIFRADTTGSANLYIYTNGLSGSQSWYVDDVSLVHRPDLSASFNNMTNGYRFEPTRLTRGYKSGANEDLSFTPVVGNSADLSIRAVIRPQFPADTGDSLNSFVLTLVDTATNDLHSLYYSPSDNKFRFQRYQSSAGLDESAYSPVMAFSQDEEVEIGASFDTTNGTRIYVNGSNVGATNSANTTGVTTTPNKLWVGRYYVADIRGAYIIDDLEILAKSQPAEWFAEQHAKRNAAKNLNLPFKYSSTLNAGDILTVNALDPKVRGRVEMYHASSGTTSNGMGVANVGGSLMPILSPTKSMLYFPNSIPSGVEIYYRENHQ